jgi:hypothetical protein
VLVAAAAACWALTLSGRANAQPAEAEVPPEQDAGPRVSETPAPAPVPPPNPNPLRDVAVDPGLPVVVVDGRYTRVSGGRIAVSCGTAHTLREGMFERSITVPCSGASAQPSVLRTRPRSVVLTAVGVSMAAVGALSLFGGMYMHLDSDKNSFSCFFCVPNTDYNERMRGEVFMGFGIVLAVLSVPFIIIGQSRVPVGDDPASVTTARAPRLGLSF